MLVLSKYYSITNILYLFALLISICVALIVLGAYLITRSILRINRIDSRVKKLKENTEGVNI